MRSDTVYGVTDAARPATHGDIMLLRLEIDARHATVASGALRFQTELATAKAEGKIVVMKALIVVLLAVQVVAIIGAFIVVGRINGH